MNNHIYISEIGPRDGFQNVKQFIATETKLQIIDGLVAAGLGHIQITSFVSPKAIPQLRDAGEVVEACIKKYPQNDFFVLALNRKGVELAVQSGIKKVSYVISVSESHNKANGNKTVKDSFEELKGVIEDLPEAEITLDVATAYHCPFEGAVSYDAVKNHVETARNMGIQSFTICDTIGKATPLEVKTYMSNLILEYPDCSFHAHIHDTRNMGILNSLVAAECGAASIQLSIGGLGGCPFAPGASGNTATEDFVYMLNRMGYNTGVDFSKLMDTAKYAKQEIAGVFSGHQINVELQ